MTSLRFSICAKTFVNVIRSGLPCSLTNSLANTGVKKSLITLSEDAQQFYNKWIGELDYINTTMRAIRKVQTECSLIDTCFNKPETLDKTYDGYCFDKLVRNDGLYQFIVFLPELKLASKITVRDNLENYEKRQYKLYLFNDEEKFKRKIRLQLI